MKEKINRPDAWTAWTISIAIVISVMLLAVLGAWACNQLFYTQINLWGAFLVGFIAAFILSMCWIIAWCMQ